MGMLDPSLAQDDRKWIFRNLNKHSVYLPFSEVLTFSEKAHKH